MRYILNRAIWGEDLVFRGIAYNVPAVYDVLAARTCVYIIYNIFSLPKDLRSPYPGGHGGENAARKAATAVARPFVAQCLMFSPTTLWTDFRRGYDSATKRRSRAGRYPTGATVRRRSYVAENGLVY
jgi:hypothetical protein